MDMNERLRRWKRHPLATVPGVTLLMSIGGCFSGGAGWGTFGGGPDGDWGVGGAAYSCAGADEGSSSYSCQAGSGSDYSCQGSGTPPGFQSVCPTDAGDDGGSVFTFDDAGRLAANIHEGSELGCVLSEFFPTVVTGAPLGIEYLQTVSSDAGTDAAETGTSTVILPVVPAVPSVVLGTSVGWLLPPDRYVTFLAMDGKRIADHVDVVAHDVAMVRMTTFGLGCWSDFDPFLPSISPPGFADAGCVIPAGNVTNAVAMMQDDAGRLLGGPTECSFTSTAPEVAQIAGRGIVAHITALTEGDAMLLAACGGHVGNVILHVSAAPGDAGDAALQEAGELDSAADAGDAP